MNIILATSKNGAIGNNNQLLFKQSDDLKRFKTLTTNNVVVMGRKTFDSLNNKPLPNRINIVITRNDSLYQTKTNDLYFVGSVTEAIVLSKTIYPEKQIFVIGGAEIYRQSLSLCKKIYLTLVDTVVKDYDASIDLETIFNDKYIQKIVGKGSADKINEFDYVYFEIERI
jgi:dihydrofolate reductase